MGRSQDLAKLADVLRVTAQRLQDGAAYRWSHQGMCNCGQVAQTVTRLDRATLHRMALEKAGDWSEHAVDHCPDSGFPIDHVIDALKELGMTEQDIVHLERLSDPSVLHYLPVGQRQLDKRDRDDVIRYLHAWATHLD